MDLSDLQERIGASFGDGPAHDPIDVVIRRGHRALTHQRILRTTTAGVVAATIAGAGILVTGFGDDTSSPDPAVRPTGPAQVTSLQFDIVEDATRAPCEDDLLRCAATMVRLEMDAETPTIHYRSGVRPSLIIDHLPGDTVGLEVEGQAAGVRWVVLTTASNGDRTTWTEVPGPGKYYVSFQDYALIGSGWDAGPPEAATAGTTLDLPGFRKYAVRTKTINGVQWYIVQRDGADGALETYATSIRASYSVDLPMFLEWARDAYAGLEN